VNPISSPHPGGDTHRYNLQMTGIVIPTEVPTLRDEAEGSVSLFSPSPVIPAKAPNPVYFEFSSFVFLKLFSA
jgi:hypothetical protein